MAGGAYFGRTVATARAQASRTFFAWSGVYWHSRTQPENPGTARSSDVTRSPSTSCTCRPPAASPARRTATTSTLLKPAPAITSPREFSASTDAFVKSAGSSNVNGTSTSEKRLFPSGSPAALQPVTLAASRRARARRRTAAETSAHTPFTTLGPRRTTIRCMHKYLLGALAAAVPLTAPAAAAEWPYVQSHRGGSVRGGVATFAEESMPGFRSAW